MGSFESKLKNAIAYHLSNLSNGPKFTESRRESADVSVHYWPAENEKEEIAILLHQGDDPWGMHTHDYYVLNYVFGGSFNVVVNGTEMTMQKGETCFLQPQAMHQIKGSVHTAEANLILSIAIKSTLIQRVILTLVADNETFPHFFDKTSGPSENVKIGDAEFFDTSFSCEMNSLFETLLIESCEKADSQDAFIKYVLICVLILLSREKSKSINHTVFDTERILDYIEKNCATVTLQNVAAHFHYNPVYLSNQLKEKTGSSFRELLKRFRMERVMALLGTNLPVGAVASLAGYANLGNFHQVFKKETGLTPAQYRENNKHNPKP